MSQIFFAWADGSERTFDPIAHAREDEDVFSFTLTHEEGQIPTLDVVLRYPEIDGVAIGLLRSTRKQWCWLSWRNPDDIIEPLFFGRLVGFPQNVNDIIVPLRFHSRAGDFVAQKQALADTLRVRPFYDPIFLSDAALEDPENILEGWSCAYHVDRITLQWSISDILIGDEVVSFDQGDIIDGSVTVSAKEAPIRAVRVDATVNWKQHYRGTVIPVWIGNPMKSYNPQGLADAFPKVGASLGGGWVVAAGSQVIVRGGRAGENSENSGSWTDESKHHNDGDAISIQWSSSIPLGSEQFELKETASYGNMGGGVDFLNAPSGQISTGEQSGQSSSSYSASWKVVYSGSIQPILFIQPDGSPNNFTETISLTLAADIQNLLTDATSQEETEVISLNGQDIGEAVIDFKCLTTLSGQTVQTGQILLPNLTPGPGGTSYQIALNDGTVGVVTSEEDAPLFSDVVGVVTIWGGVEFACIGASLPTIMSWQPNTWVEVGALLCAEEFGGWFFVCDQDGFTGEDTPFQNILGFTLPNIDDRNARIPDGGVVWIALGAGGPSLHVPAQGLPGNIVANSFFDKDRGAACIEYMIMIARNKIRTRARAIEISFRVPFHKAVDLSCRKSATIQAPKVVPGGWASGKIIAYTLSRSGMTGEIYAEVTIGCAIGAGSGDAAAVNGAPTVAELEALEGSAQRMDGAQTLIGTEVSYAPPPPDLTYNGFRFPLTRDQVVLYAGWVGSWQQQLQDFLRLMRRPGGAMLMGLRGAIQQAQQMNAAREKEFKDPFSFEFHLRPISDQHTETPYVVSVSKLTVPKQIDLGA
jgi:hypothetical protein